MTGIKKILLVDRILAPCHNVLREESKSDMVSSDDDDEDEDMNMDTTRSQLSSLFHRVSEVCMQEFQLLGHVFEDQDVSVARALCARVMEGLQQRINNLLESIDRASDFDSGTKKLDTFVVIHEKAAGLFGLLQDAAERLLRQSSDARTAVESLKSFLHSQEIARHTPS